jgi:predicted lipid-binding transport protein (Tim44 family)
VIDARADPVAPPTVRKLPERTSNIGQVLESMQSADRGFAPAPFLNGAEAAFRLIVNAFAAGDRAKLQPLLTPDIFAAFDHAITARDSAGETQQTEIRAILEATIEGASLQGTHAEINVRFVSQQIAMTHAADGSIVAGADAVTELVDIWTFVRDLNQAGAVWQLASAHSA